MIIRILLLFTLTSCFLTSALQSQEKGKTDISKKASKHFIKAGEYYLQRNYPQSLEELDMTVRIDPEFARAYALRGDIFTDLNKLNEAAADYEKAASIMPGMMDYKLYLILGDIYLATGRYSESKANYQKYLDYGNIPDDHKVQVEQNLKRCEFGILSVSNPVSFNPVNLGDSINTKDDEYINAITADGQILFFTRRLPVTSGVEGFSRPLQEDFFFTLRCCDTAWNKSLNLGAPINTRGNEGALTVSPDRQFLFFAACERSDGFGSCDIYRANKAGDQWLIPVNLGDHVNSGAWESQPSFSSDGKTLYFVSQRKGGFGGSDIWMTTIQLDGTWTFPVNLGDSVNTLYDEQAPFIHPDDQTLYFSSKGHMGLGGLDLFVTRKDKDGNWKKSQNLGYPINTFADEIAVIVNSAGDVGYISSDMDGGKGRQDIYSFLLYEDARPMPVTFLKGIVYDKETGKKLSARFELISISENRITATSVSDPTDGSFLICIPTDRDYALNVSKEGYLFFSDHFSLSGIYEETKPFLRDIPLQPMKIGETVILRNIFFDTDQYTLKPESFIELEKLLELLQTNPSIRIEINGHTDIVGTEEHNLKLSQNRAKAVFDYLTGKGIDARRLTFKGYGYGKPIDTNDTEEGRANNRRTEFVITGN